MDVDGREIVGAHHNFTPIYYFLGVNGIRGAKNLPHYISHMFDTLRVNLSYLPLRSNTPRST
jgi:hypothetical protein